MNKLTFIRKYKKRLTTQNLADKLGISRSQYSNKEKGLYEFTLSESINLSKILDIDDITNIIDLQKEFIKLED